MCLAVPAKIVQIEGDRPLEKVGKVSFGGIVKNNISLAYVPEAEIGNYVIVHAGFALSLVNEDEAKQTLTDLAEIQNLS